MLQFRLILICAFVSLSANAAMSCREVLLDLMRMQREEGTEVLVTNFQDAQHSYCSLACVANVASSARAQKYGKFVTFSQSDLQQVMAKLRDAKLASDLDSIGKPSGMDSEGAEEAFQMAFDLMAPELRAKVNRKVILSENIDPQDLAATDPSTMHLLDLAYIQKGKIISGHVQVVVEGPHPDGTLLVSDPNSPALRVGFKLEPVKIRGHTSFALIPNDVGDGNFVKKAPDVDVVIMGVTTIHF